MIGVEGNVYVGRTGQGLSGVSVYAFEHSTDQEAKQDKSLWLKTGGCFDTNCSDGGQICGSGAYAWAGGDVNCGGTFDCSPTYDSLTITPVIPAGYVFPPGVSPNGYFSPGNIVYNPGSLGNSAEQVANFAWVELPPPQPVGTIQGYKVLMPGNQNTVPAQGQTVYLDGAVRTAGNPYILSGIPAGNHTVSVSVPVGYTVGYTLCYNNISCHNNPPVMYSSVNVNVPDGGYVDLWWHYFPAPYPVCDSLTVSPAGGAAPLSTAETVTAHMVNGGAITKYQLNISGLGSFTQTIPTFATVFPNPGTYTVNAQVIDDKGQASALNPACSKTVSVSVPQISCSLSLTPPTIVMNTSDPGQTVNGVLQITGSQASSGSINFSSSNTGIARVNPATRPVPNSFGYNSTVNPVSPGSAVISAQATVTNKYGVSGSCTSSTPVSVQVTALPAWWQVNSNTGYGDVFGQSGVVSKIPGTCHGSCINWLDLGEGIVSTNASINTGAGQINGKGWNYRTSLGSFSSKYGYSYWSGKFLSQADPVPGNLTTNTLQTAVDSITPGGMKVVASTGSMTVNNRQNIDPKVSGNQTKALLVFVPGNLYVNAPVIRLNPRLFLMFVVEGNITVADDLKNGSNPILDGVYITDKVFDTGSGTGITEFRGNGIFMAAQGFNLNRNLQILNNSQPAEVFTFDPSLVINAPGVFNLPNYKWDEIAP